MLSYFFLTFTVFRLGAFGILWEHKLHLAGCIQAKWEFSAASTPEIFVQLILNNVLHLAQLHSFEVLLSCEAV